MFHAILNIKFKQSFVLALGISLLKENEHDR